MNNSSPIPPHLQAPLPPNSQWTFDLIERKSWASLWIFVNNITGDIYCARRKNARQPSTFWPSLNLGF
jgi:hypothetical protein